MARKFLYVIAILIVLIIAGGLALSYFADDLTEFAFVPDTAFAEQDALPDNAYADGAMWISRPGMDGNDPARWLPDGFTETDGRMAAAVFFVHPTSFVENTAWNAPLDDAASRQRADLFVRGMASPFNRAEQIWAPRYRQAAVGAFLTDRPEAQRAIDAAYRDVEQAFAQFVEEADPALPIVLAGHSQGALHLRRLLRERIAGTPVADRIAAAYIIGWPISVANDLPALGLPACGDARQSGCVMSWSSFAEPADPDRLLRSYSAGLGLNGLPNAETELLCSNPLTGGIGGAAPASANLGTLVPNADFTSGRLVEEAVPARCDPRGILLIGDPPDLGNAVLPGNNYHVYDIPLFWANLRRDVAARVSAWNAAQGGASSPVVGGR
ncbi:DUF3089 domain-containing protein [Croceicoccus sp. YJ47]|uniref:DUF3089 domain-containing protein n=1 Tax=Croceicoccus sp. YJ47 TaxID=2798724 RepID=UPI001921E65B|nr:DUF3089 domain-containing protein [Croceicoccus sp. YJ47]QQN74550.1 DUF3089 domain-containing protein [Croceicoccus sp. YJ47]